MMCGSSAHTGIPRHVLVCHRIRHHKPVVRCCATVIVAGEFEAQIGRPPLGVDANRGATDAKAWRSVCQVSVAEQVADECNFSVKAALYAKHIKAPRNGNAVADGQVFESHPPPEGSEWVIC